MKIEVEKSLWNQHNYCLIDCGDGAKIERFGSHILQRPEPQALWSPSLAPLQWREMVSAEFVKKGGDIERGEWKIGRNVAEQWHVEREMAKGVMRLRLGMTSFKHVGLFPEQAANWDFIQDRIAAMHHTPSVLNLFAYTGAASIAAALAGAQTTHVDSVKAVNIWARQNAEASSVDTIRYITDDAMEFVERELRREKLYDAIILDPPSYGRGPDGQKWVLELHLRQMLERCARLLDKRSGSFMVLNLYSMGLSPILAHTLLQTILGDRFDISCGELFVQDNADKRLPLGLFVRAVAR